MSLLKTLVSKLKTEWNFTAFLALMSFLNGIFFHYPFFKFVLENNSLTSFWGIVLFISLVLVLFVANFFAFYLVFIQRWVGKIFLILIFLISSIAVYFINTYGIIVDESMIGNVLNTNYEESSAYFSVKMLLYAFCFAILPILFIIQVKINPISTKKYLKHLGVSLLFLVVVSFINAPNWRWVDSNSKQLGGLAMPWSYLVNTALFYVHKKQANQVEIKLPDAKIKNKEKAVFVLVIGESARRKNFSLYGYEKNTNPLLAKEADLKKYIATSCDTYTTAGVKCILEHKNTGDLYEILPNYLERNGVEVFWHTSNWGEPPVHTKNYFKASELRADCKEKDCLYDGVLFANIKERIASSQKEKVLLIIHTSTSHGPNYSEKYPPEYSVFQPVCQSVEPGKCTQESLVNSYDNSIVYTDYLLHKTIQDLKAMEGIHTAMLYVSDHGESLGENNLYMHGTPMLIAPREQYEIPFLLWHSHKQKQAKSLQEVNQHFVFHSVLNFLDVESSIYNKAFSIFE